MWFQVILIVALVGIGIYLVRSPPSALAQLVGIGRGADLLFYLAIVAGLLYVVNEYKRSVQLQRANTQLAREIALTEARLTDRIAELEARLGEREHP